MRVALLFFFVVICSCSGYDGDDGRVYIEFHWFEEPDYYFDDNPFVPSTINQREWYETLPLLVNFEYGFSDGYGWYGQYEVKEGEPGEEGRFFWNDGENGRDNFYTLILTYNGLEFSNAYEKDFTNSIYAIGDTLSYIISGDGKYLEVKQIKFIK